MKTRTAEAETASTNPLTQALKSELTRRCEKNPRYSLRSFARSLGVDHSLLAKILRGERRVSAGMIWKVGQAINIKPEQLTKWSIESRENREGRKVRFNILKNGKLSILTEWYHFALLELTLLPEFSTQPQWIAKKLQITVAEARMAIDRLQESGRLTINENGEWVLGDPNNSWADLKATNEIRKRLQKQFLEKALTAIDSVPFEDRENGSMTMAISRKMIPHFKNRIEEFKKSLLAEAEMASNYDAVYQVCVAFYPISTITKTSKEN
jgi:transcriptional regulator with XRE-family HTH domain